MRRLSAGIGSALVASGITGALVFMGTIIYCADRVGWAGALALGWAPALVMASAAALGNLAISAMLGLRSPNGLRRHGVQARKAHR